MADVFTITVILPEGPYPSVNHLGADGLRGGKKTPQYHQLRSRILKAADDEVARTGWVTADYYVSGTFIRYHPDRLRRDPGNHGKAEADFLQLAGVVKNDTLIDPIEMHTEYDPDGENRMTIILVRRYPPMLVMNEVREPQVAKKPRQRKAEPVVTEKSASLRGVSSDVALLNGVPISRDQALRMIRGDLSLRK